jgi:3'-phosphoadenosine 5'-phosphosulfate sulfotransferase (PAPS reductase)/FAD synthetase
MNAPIRFFGSMASGGKPASVSVHPDVEQLLARNAVVAVGVSGGKDSQACALAVASHLDAIGHTGPRILVHADLGRVEWKDSLPTCQRLADHLGWELLVVQRKAGDMLSRWQGRWKNNVARYVDLECVKLILPWSTPSMRFCTSELKVAVIESALKKRFAGQDVINVTGVRREESANRAKAPVAKSNPDVVKEGGTGFTWNAIIDLSIGQVFSTIEASGLALHEGYTVHNMSRISCVFCIMSNLDDMQNSAACEDNVPVYLDMVEIEAVSTFAFQGSRWLADVAPHLVGEELGARVAHAKEMARVRVAAESRLPKHLLYTKGWPTAVPTMAEAELLADVRRIVSESVGLRVNYLDPADIISRYQQLLSLKAAA